MTVTVITGGQLLDQNGQRTADVAVDNVTGNIVDIGVGLSGDRSLDATGCVVMPGFVDLHVHLREPGMEAAETVVSGSRAAALGGFTAVVAMPNTTPATDSVAVVSQVLEAARDGLCQVKPSAAITIGREGHELSPMAELAAIGVRMFTDDGTGVQNDRLMRRALEYASTIPTDDGVPIVVAQHCEVSVLSEGGVMHEGEVSARLGLGGQPAEAEELMVMRDIALARRTGARVHFQHLSTAGSVAMVRAARRGGVPVTAEATPHHLCLTDHACEGYDPIFKVHPPLRTEGDCAAVVEGLRDGTIDAIATDHAPHTPDSKERPFDQAPPGMLGLETALGVALSVGFELVDLVGPMSANPARIGGLARHGGPIETGRPANLAVIDPNFRWTVAGTGLASLAHNTPFEGWELAGKARHTLFEGEPVVIDFEAQK